MNCRLPLSYTQNLEDYHLSLAFAGQHSGFYIDVGAGHPVADNVSFWFYERGWRGIVVEPQPELAALYARLRPRDVAVCALLGGACGERNFHLVDRLHGLSTTVEQHAQAASKFGASYQTVRMPVTTLAQLCARHSTAAIDFLKIDVEGAEADVLMGADWRRWRPRIVLVEAVTPGSGEPAWAQWEPLLLQYGYRFALFDRLNRFYVAPECPDLLDRIPATPAPWTSVRHMYEIGRAPENPLHPDYALAQDLARGFWASLPYLEDELILSILRRARSALSDAELEKLSALVKAESFRAALGRIACGYDGGQIIAPGDQSS